MAHLRRFGQGPPLQPEGDLIRSKPIPPDRRPVLFSTFLEFIFISAAFVALARLLFSWHQRRRRQSFAFLPMQPAMNPSEVVAIDCTHGSLPTLTHHKDDSNPLGAPLLLLFLALQCAGCNHMCNTTLNHVLHVNLLWVPARRLRLCDFCYCIGSCAVRTVWPPAT